MTTQRPNILIIYPDQWRADALGCASDPVVRTPHLDRLAGEGLRCTHAFVANPVCTPSRGSFMTGRYPHATGVTHNEAPMPKGEVCFAESLAAAGYRTGYIGKWHLDGAPRPGFVPPERRHGWHYWAAFNRGHRYYDGVYFRDTPEELPTPGFEPDYQTDLAIDFLTTATPDDRPFCLLLAWGPPHTPLDPPARHRDTYRPAEVPLPASVPPAVAEQARAERARYYGLVTALDDNVGRLLDALDRLGLAADTIVLFTSDHGDALGEHGRFRKTIPYDEATRVPCIVRWPGHVPADATTDAFWHSVDIAPTLLSLCGVAHSPQIQGVDLAPTVLGGGAGPREAVYMEGRAVSPPDAAGSRPVHPLAGDWRALRTRDALLATDLGGRSTLLFDLKADPLAQQNLAGQTGGARPGGSVADAPAAGGPPPGGHRAARRGVRARLAARASGKDMTMTDLQRSARLSRRRALCLLGGAGVTALLAACGTVAATVPPATPPPAVPARTTTGGDAGATSGKPTARTAAASAALAAVTTGRTPTAGTPTAGASGTLSTAITLPNTGVKLPTQDVTFRWVQSGPGPKGLFFKEYFAAYQQAHPNIAIHLDELPWPEIEKVVPLGVQSGNAPDVFQIPQNATVGQAVQEGWVRPLDDIIPAFARWKMAFPPGSSLDGVHVFNGKTYTFPFISNKLYGTLLLYNVEYAQRGGIDLQSKPLTWDEYRAATKKLTQSTDLMPTILDWFDAPVSPRQHGTSLRPVLGGDTAIHDALIYGYFGMATNVTDGRYTYFRNPLAPDAEVDACTAMPTQFHGFTPREQLARAETGRFLGHTDNIPVFEIPQPGKAPRGYEEAGAERPRHGLYDLATAPGQGRSRADPTTEARMCAALGERLARVAAPQEQWTRLGL